MDQKRMTDEELEFKFKNKPKECVQMLKDLGRQDELAYWKDELENYFGYAEVHLPLHIEDLRSRSMLN